jgi:ABC-2 type transport system permease protein
MFRYLVLEIRRMFRDKRFVFFTMAIPVVFYLLWSNMFTSGGRDSVTGLDAKVYLLVSMATYGAIGAALTTTGSRLATERKTGWLRQLQVTPLRPGTVIATKVAAATILALPSLVVVSLTAVLDKHVHLSAGEWAAMMAVLWIGSLPFAALGTLIGSLASPDAAQPITLACYFTLSIVGGLWVPVGELPATLRRISRALPSNRYADLGWKIAGGHTPSLADGLVLAAWAAGIGFLAVLAYRRVTVKS